MLKKEDLKQIHDKGISEEQINRQLEDFKRGFPYLKLEGAATPKKGVMVLDKNACEATCKAWLNYQTHGHKVVKFVPASGAASRMFKDLFAFLNGNNEAPISDFEKEFFSNIHHFAFYEALSAKCQQLEGKTIDALIAEGRYKAVVATLLNKEGLNYGQLPKGLFLFHSYDDGARTPMEEHLVEAARYAESNKQAHVHFTVSHEHLAFFKQRVADKQAKFEDEYVKLYKKDKAKANKLLNEFSINMMKEAKALTQNLTNEIFTMLTDDTDAKLKSLNKGKKD